MGSLLAVGGTRILVEFPHEPTTGADMEWNFVDIRKGTFFRILLQAKRASGEGKIWSRHRYRELFHATANSSVPQAVALCDAARKGDATFPLYAFYHPTSTCDDARVAGYPYVSGICLADGYKIETLVKAATNQTSRIRNKSLKTIAPLHFPLSQIFCPATILPLPPQALAPQLSGPLLAIGRNEGRTVVGTPIPPTPEMVRDRIVQVRIELAELRHIQFLNEPPVPAVATNIPKEVVAAINSDRTSAPKRLRRWRITFLSSTTESRSLGT